VIDYWICVFPITDNLCPLFYITPFIIFAYFCSKLGIFVAAGKEEQKLPYLLYLQGGPGFECRQPTESSGWVQKVCEEFRLILMDQAWFTRHLCNHLCGTVRTFIYNLSVAYVHFYSGEQAYQLPWLCHQCCNSSLLRTWLTS